MVDRPSPSTRLVTFHVSLVPDGGLLRVRRGREVPSDAIHAGMTEREVRAVLDAQFPVAGRFRRNLLVSPMESRGFSVVLDPTDRRYDSAVVQIRFTNGRSAGAGFLAD